MNNVRNAAQRQIGDSILPIAYVKRAVRKPDLIKRNLNMPKKNLQESKPLFPGMAKDGKLIAIVFRHLRRLPLLNDAHYINIHVRRGGKDEIYEADWLKEVMQLMKGEE